MSPGESVYLREHVLPGGLHVPMRVGVPKGACVLGGGSKCHLGDCVSPREHVLPGGLGVPRGVGDMGGASVPREMSLGRNRASSTNKGILVTACVGLRCVLGGAGWGGKGRDAKSPGCRWAVGAPTCAVWWRRRDSNLRLPRCRRRAGRKARPGPVSRDAGAGSGAGGGAGSARSVSPGGSGPPPSLSAAAPAMGTSGSKSRGLWPFATPAAGGGGPEGPGGQQALARARAARAATPFVFTRRG